MAEFHPQQNPPRTSPMCGVLVILATGVLLGAGYNVLARQSTPSRGLPWIAERVELADLDSLLAADGVPEVREENRAPSPLPSKNPAEPSADTNGAAPGSTVASPVSPASPQESNDPMAIVGTAAPGEDLPPIPDVGRPIPMNLSRAKQFFDKKAAMFIDARDPDEYAAGRIPGAVNLPSEAITDPERLENLDSRGRPVIVYCGGGTCEVSTNLAFALMQAGKKEVLVFMGGYPEWEAAGFPVERGAPAPDGAGR